MCLPPFCVVTMEQRVYPAPAAGTDTLLRFEQPTAAHLSSAVFSSINTLDKTIAVPHGSSKVVLHTFSGSSQSSMDFMPGQQVLSPGDPVSFTPAGGRSSNGVLPYFGVEIVTALPPPAAASNVVVSSKFLSLEQATCFRTPPHPPRHRRRARFPAGTNMMLLSGLPPPHPSICQRCCAWLTFVLC